MQSIIHASITACKNLGVYIENRSFSRSGYLDHGLGFTARSKGCCAENPPTIKSYRTYPPPEQLVISSRLTLSFSMQVLKVGFPLVFKTLLRSWNLKKNQKPPPSPAPPLLRYSLIMYIACSITQSTAIWKNNSSVKFYLKKTVMNVTVGTYIYRLYIFWWAEVGIYHV